MYALSSDDNYNGFFRDISAISERIFFKPKAYFFINDHPASIYMVVFILPPEVVINLKRPLPHY